LTGECSAFTVKVIIDRYVLTAILLIVYWLFLYFFSLPYYFFNYSTLVN